MAAAEPLLSEDVVRWRRVALERLLTQSAVSVDKIDTIISQVMADFVHWRHQISMPPQSIAILNQLAQRYPLVAITNGNVEPHRIGLSQFSLCLRGGEHGRAKPHFDLFAQTMQHFQVQPHQILHIGDNLHTDVQGAIQAGCQAVWLNLNAEPIRRHAESRNLPTLELTDLQQLLFLA
ncbi:putative hydrolase of the HAD superfamily [Pasteurella testudinis DSM 23072]|uniref:Putative hydrolase of the HAD superfamily n=1 Tax=Pasteurella testudinis DSM 23072 TaxID=1122938 RepID=A0A1W1V4H2_9PAST|nr:putative hydrolase of the HAD superfamily [Pasteurella testudinis DSM 23072]SUB51155.1 protein YigB [Pasteurella testudinis]